MHHHSLICQAIVHRLAQDCQSKLVLVKGVRNAVCAIVVASNKSPEELQKAENLERIRTVQRVLGARELPIWCIPRQAWYVPLL